MNIIENIKYGKYDANVLDVYIPNADVFPVFVYFHGGSLESGSKKVAFIGDLVKKGVAVVSGDYRMYKSAVFPEFIEDGAAVVAWAKENMGQYGKVTGLYVGGSSAGAYITQMLCFDKKYLAKHSMSNSDIAGYYHNAEQPTTHFNVLRERGMDQRRAIIDEAAPLYYVDDAEQYPPMEIVVADHDMENRYEQTMLLVSTLKHFCHDMSKIYLKVMENSTHCEYDSAVNENGNYVLAEMIYDFIKKTL